MPNETESSLDGAVGSWKEVNKESQMYLVNTNSGRLELGGKISLKSKGGLIMNMFNRKRFKRPIGIRRAFLRWHLKSSAAANNIREILYELVTKSKLQTQVAFLRFKYIGESLERKKRVKLSRIENIVRI